jgi:hypothetical protein
LANHDHELLKHDQEWANLGQELAKHDQEFGILDQEWRNHRHDWQKLVFYSKNQYIN